VTLALKEPKDYRGCQGLKARLGLREILELKALQGLKALKD
jgi:hypothetical protein